jgi:hypothetical protein
MRSRLTIVASFAALLTFAASASAQAQESAQSSTGQAIPDAPAPQPQKKPAPKPQPPADSKDSPSTPPADAPAPTQPPAKDENAFPEAVSRDAAAKAASDGAGSTKPATANDNPFPEAVSREAAKAAGNDPNPAPKSTLPPGVSSSQSAGDLEDTPNPAEARHVLPSPGRSKKDTEVGGFYLDSGNYQGALERFQDAMANDPTNVDAIFGLAQAQQMLKSNADAARNYQLYLDIVPNGPKSKQAIKALKTLQAAK